MKKILTIFLTFSVLVLSVFLFHAFDINSSANSVENSYMDVHDDIYSVDEEYGFPYFTSQRACVNYIGKGGYDRVLNQDEYVTVLIIDGYNGHSGIYKTCIDSVFSLHFY